MNSWMRTHGDAVNILSRGQSSGCEVQLENQTLKSAKDGQGSRGRSCPGRWEEIDVNWRRLIILPVGA